MSRLAEHLLIFVLTLVPLRAQAQSPPNIAALTGLAPVAALPNSPEGKAALAANLKITGDIQIGALQQPLLMSFSEQQKFALRDSFITDGNATELADGLGSKLGAAYQERAQYKDTRTFASISPSISDLIGYTNNITKSDSNAGKYFFANATTNGKTPVSEAATAILTANGGVTDVFGKAYGRPAGSQGADAYGNSRPFQTEPRLIAFRGEDYFGRPSHSLDWLRGPNQNLFDSPSYPSGHTTYGYTEAVVLAILVPERYQQMIARAAEYGNDRIVVGAHYAMDVLGGRATALHAVAHLLANDPAYVGQTRKNPAVLNEMSHGPDKEIVVTDYTVALKAARADLDAFLNGACGDTIAICAAADNGRFKDPTANEALYNATQTYGLPVVHQSTADMKEDVGKIAPEAGHLLTAAFPSITLAEANAILTETQGPGGGFLDDGSSFGVYSRLNLYAAAGRAAALAANRVSTEASAPSRTRHDR
ncbi:phosphatase PAP2 family protein [Methylobacterium sp. J-030]|uniref:phosphatase PAP2 family protein n=1 Tax=Methylobacterium sp. J-030 TaxID=2836627 RepID=UPI001FBABDE5|nr:phosphatase PAP2 family protein [Methylobacterium sp. J-030]MCJ2072477.1 phosphatase PAP2 family protein [Methylobacterium sp. J-030]